MESRAKFLGHPIHPMLIVFPLGLLATSLILDIIYWITGNLGPATAAYWCMGIGIIGGLVAAVPGFWDWLAIPKGTRAKRIGLWHGAGNVVVVVIFIISWLIRFYQVTHAPNVVATILAVLGVALAVVTGWLGGEMVDRLGVGVDPGANLDAPSSLSRLPAREAATGQLRQVA
jgi:uncharacterized membrane protein